MFLKYQAVKAPLDSWHRHRVVFAASVLVLILGHLPTLGMPVVNQEWVFAEAAQSLR
jgi:hypothetical protein